MKKWVNEVESLNERLIYSIIKKEDDAVPYSPGFPMPPQLCPHQSEDQSLPAQLRFLTPASSLGPACESRASNWRGPLRASILVCHSLRKGVARHQPLTLIFPHYPRLYCGSGRKTACSGWCIWNVRAGFCFCATVCKLLLKGCFWQIGAKIWI